MIRRRNVLGLTLAIGLIGQQAFAENEVVKADSTEDTAPTTENISDAETLVTIDAADANPLCFTDEITTFLDDEIPVDSSLFFKHVNSLEFQIPMDYNSEVKRFIDYFGTSWQSKLKEMITLSEHYFPVYESILDKNDLPLELKYVSVIESALNPYATSRSGAVGLWQFMPYTGKIYDLKIDRYQDERRDVKKSTAAAAHYFKDMPIVKNE